MPTKQTEVESIIIALLPLLKANFAKDFYELSQNKLLL